MNRERHGGHEGVAAADLASDGLAPARDLVEAATRFVRLLRARGLLATPQESIDVVRALEAVDLTDRREVHLALRALLTSRREDLAPFDDAFAEWWRAYEPARERAVRDSSKSRKARDANPPAAPPSPSPTRQPGLLALQKWGAPNDESEDGEASIPMPSTNEALASRDFSSFTSDQLDEIERVARRMARRLSSRPSRRWKPEPRGTRVHLRGLMRESLRTGGDIVQLSWQSRRLRRTSIVALCDVSGSMDLYSRFLLQFLYALQQSFARIETFVFSTRYSRITEHLARDSYREALDRLARDVSGWSGGTKIGESIAHFVADHPRLVDRRTIVVVMSDGWDTGDPATLAEAMRQLHRRAGRVIWLNPLLAAPGYRPLTRGVQAALPFVDVFAPVHNLESLERLVRHLSL